MRAELPNALLWKWPMSCSEGVSRPGAACRTGACRVDSNEMSSARLLARTLGRPAIARALEDYTRRFLIQRIL